MEIGSNLLGVVRLVPYVLFTVLCMPIQAVLVGCGWHQMAAKFPRWYHRRCIWLIGLKVDVVGEPAPIRPTLFVSNHSSYLDIPVLGACIPGSFIAKTEVGTWPMFGLLAKLQRTVFIDRTARGKAHEQRDSMIGRLLAGDSLILFPEGTSSDGNRTLPFKTALFSVAATRVNEVPLTVQPVSVTATHLDDIPLGHRWRSLYAWFGDMELPPHLWRMVRAGRIRVTVEFHAPVSLAQFSSRKALADHCWRTVATGVERAVRGQALPVKQGNSTSAPLAAAG